VQYAQHLEHIFTNAIGNGVGRSADHQVTRVWDAFRPPQVRMFNETLDDLDDAKQSVRRGRTTA
jgi:hypothetical protein